MQEGKNENSDVPVNNEEHLYSVQQQRQMERLCFHSYASCSSFISVVNGVVDSLVNVSEWLLNVSRQAEQIAVEHGLDQHNVYKL
jgi:hypothetical protein